MSWLSLQARLLQMGLLYWAGAQRTVLSSFFFFFLLHTDIIYHQRTIPRATVSDYITDGPLDKMQGQLLSLLIQVLCLFGSSYIIRWCRVSVQPPDEV